MRWKKIGLLFPALIAFCMGCSPAMNSNYYTSAKTFLYSTMSSPMIAGTPFSLSITAIQRFNGFGKYTGTVKITSSDPVATLPAAHQFVNTDSGTFTFQGIKFNTPGTQTLTISDGTASVITTGTAVNSLCVAGKQTFSFTGSNQNFTVPAYCTSLYVKMWGAGGGGSRITTAGGNGTNGGSGGFVMGTLSVIPGKVYTLIIPGGGQPGAGGVGSHLGGFGGGGNGFARNGGGGGRSAIQLSGVELLTAAGGGGAGYSIPQDRQGGAGGGTSGIAGTGDTVSGQAGTQSAGGAAGVGSGVGSPGSQFAGGNGNTSFGSGGGGGYYGGGGSGYNVLDNGAGGGGSSYIVAAAKRQSKMNNFSGV
jgi:hypothetical protein